MSIEIKSDILAKELNQGIVPLGVPKAYQYDAALVEAARAAVNQGIDDVAEAGDTAVNSVKVQESTSTTNINTLGDKILAQMKHGYGYPFTAANAAAMTDAAKIYVYTGSETGYTNGNWYYWNGTAWTSGGVYNATALETDKTLTISGAAADAKATSMAISAEKNLEVTWIDGIYISGYVIVPHELYSTTDYIYVGGLKQIIVETTIEGYATISVFNGGKGYKNSYANVSRKVIDITDDITYIRFSCVTANKGTARIYAPKIIDLIQYNSLMTGGPIVAENQFISDVNNAEINKVYNVMRAGNIVDNTPQAQGTFITLNSANRNDGRFQLFSATDNKLYHRIDWAGWRDWKEIAHMDNIVIRPNYNITEGYYVHFSGGGLTPHENFLYAEYDVSNLKGVYLSIISGMGDLAGGAFYDKNGNFINGIPDTTGSVSLKKVTAKVPNNALILRVSCILSLKYGMDVSVVDLAKAVSDINILPADISNPLSKIKETPGMTAIFHKFCCIGDSLASGEHEYKRDNNTTGYVDLYPYSWGQCMARTMGATAYNLSSGGQTTRSWLQSGYANQLADTISDCYIIALGVNDMNGDSRHVPVGTSADIGTNTDSYYGNYSRIISRIKSVQSRARIFCVTMPNQGRNDNREEYNNAVRYICNNTEHCYVIDLYRYAPYINASFVAQYFNGGHMNAMGYLYTAYEFMTYIDWIINNNPSEFMDVAFIGTDYQQ